MNLMLSLLSDLGFIVQNSKDGYSIIDSRDNKKLLRYVNEKNENDLTFYAKNKNIIQMNDNSTNIDLDNINIKLVSINEIKDKYLVITKGNNLKTEITFYSHEGDTNVFEVSVTRKIVSNDNNSYTTDLSETLRFFYDKFKLTIFNNEKMIQEIRDYNIYNFSFAFFEFINKFYFYKNDAELQNIINNLMPTINSLLNVYKINIKTY